MSSSCALFNASSVFGGSFRTNLPVFSIVTAGGSGLYFFGYGLKTNGLLVGLIVLDAEVFSAFGS